MLLLLSVTLFVLWDRYHDAVFNSPEHIIHPENIRVWNAPPWVPNDYVLQALDNLPEEFAGAELNVNRPGLTEALSDAFYATPWALKVDKVKLAYPGQVDVYLAFREPMAIVDPTLPAAESFCNRTLELFPERTLALEESSTLRAVRAYQGFHDSTFEIVDAALRTPKTPDEFVEYNSQQYLVDRTGYRLPEEYFREHPEARAAKPHIVGIFYKPTTAYGDLANVSLQECMTFVDFLNDHRLLETLHIDRVCVFEGRPGQKNQYCFSTENGVMVFWGDFAEPPMSEGDGDMTTEAEDGKNTLETRMRARFDYQSQKLAIWNQMARENLEEVKTLAARPEPDAAQKAQRARRVAYDLSDVLRR